MNILLSNDDGVHALGIKILHQELMKIGKVTVVAPDRNCSGASNSLTLLNPLRAQTLDNGYISVNGTPTDAVHLGISQLMDPLPDLVVAGINNGANLGDDTLYSGTIAAATEGRHMGMPAVAVSLVGKNEQYYRTAAVVAAKIISRLKEHPLAADQILNINVPDIPYNELKGLEITRLGKRHAAEKATEKKHSSNESLYWIGEVGQPNDGGPGTDFHALKNNFVSISPIHPDLTDFKNIEITKNWIK